MRTTASPEHDYGSGVAVDKNGFVYTAAALAGQATPSKILLKKYNPSGEEQTARSLTVDRGGSVYSTFGFVTNSLGVVMVARITSSFYIGNSSYRELVVGQFSHTLAPIWVSQIGGWGELDRPSTPCIDQAGDIIVGDFFVNADYRGATMSSQGNQDVLLMKIRSTDGALVWMKRAGGAGSDFGNAVATDTERNIYVVGKFNSTSMNFSGVLLPFLGGESDGFIAKYDKDGQVIWAKRLGSAGTDSLQSVAVADDGRIIATGFAGNSIPLGEGISIPANSGFILSMDSAGNFLAARSLGTRVSPQSIARDHEGSFVISSSFTGSTTIGPTAVSSRGDTDIVIIKCSSNLNVLWAKPAGFTGNDAAGQIAVSPTGEIYLGGRYSENAYFDQLYVEGRGGFDAFVAKISSETTGIPIVTAQPQAQAVYLGTQATLSVAVTSTTPARYQWFFNGTALQNQTNATLVLNNVNQKSEGYYYVEITNDFGTTRSASALLLLRGKAPIQVTTFAGGANGQPGYQDSARGTDARFNLPNTAALQPDGVLFIPDTGNHMIRILDPGGSVGTLSGKTTPGFENGPASAALFRSPLAVAIDSARDLYVADTDNNVIRKISAFGTRAVVTYAGTGQRGYKDGALAEAQFDFPNDLVIDTAGNLFVSEFQNHTIRKVGADGRVTTVAGNGIAGYQDGIGTAAQFRFPSGLARDGNGNLYVAEWSNHTLRKITPAGVVTTLAGTPGQRGFVDGPGSSALLNTPDGVAVDAVGNLYFTEYGNHAVRRLGTDNVVTTIAGTGAPGFVNGDASQTMFRHPGGINITLDGSLVVVDTGNHAIRKITWNTAEPPPQPVAYISLHAGVTIFGVAGRKYQIEAAESAGPNAQWVVLGQLIL
ncbi:MAG: SBBP repeat-containing protein, partial [Verrucomicrobiota bacterium]